MATPQSSISHTYRRQLQFTRHRRLSIRPWRIRDLLLGAPSRKRGQDTRVAAESEAETSAGKLGSEKWEAGSQSILC